MPRQSTKSPKPVQAFRAVEFKIYPNQQQKRKLEGYLRTCCFVFNRALEHRKKAWERRGSKGIDKPVTLYDQQGLLTRWRAADERIGNVPVQFTRDALRRVDWGMQAFFRRVKLGQKPGYPRFKKADRYRSMESLAVYKYVRSGEVFVPGIKAIRARGAFDLVDVNKSQQLLRVLKRHHGWFAQVLVPVDPKPLPLTGQSVGMDLGLTALVTLDTGEKVGNPRLLRKTAKKLRSAQKALSRAKKGSSRRKKTLRRVGRIYEKIQRRRRGLAHRVSRDLVNRFDRIAHEDLNLRGLCCSRLRKSILDAAWGQLLRYISYKAESAGRVLVAVDPRGTSQECPDCGLVAPKKLSDRVHNCPCGLRCDRDHAAAQIIRHRAFRPGRGGSVSPPGFTPEADSVNREDSASLTK